MEMRIEPYQMPEQLVFNYEELKAMLSEKVAVYESMVYTDDQITAAKKDRADLNRLKKALNDERLNREREYMAPFNTFKTQVNEIISIIDKPVAVIDKQVKAFEEQQKAEKTEQIKAFWDSCEKPDGIALEEIFENRWLNASVSLKSIQENIVASIEKIKQDITVIDNLPEFSFEALQTYKQSLDLARAVSEAHRLSEVQKQKAAFEAEQAKKKAEAEAAAIRPAVTPEEVAARHFEAAESEPERQWIGFQAFLSVDEAKALGAYFKQNEIKYKSI